MLFGQLRSRQKQEKNYQSVVSTLRSNGIDSMEKAEQCRSNMLRNAKIYSLLALFVCLLILALAPSSLPWTTVILFCVLLWVWTSTISARKHIKRFIDTELHSPPG